MGYEKVYLKMGSEMKNKNDILVELDALSSGGGAVGVVNALGGAQQVAESAIEEILRLRRLLDELVSAGSALSFCLSRSTETDSGVVVDAAWLQSVSGDAIKNWEQVAQPVFEEMQPH